MQIIRWAVKEAAHKALSALHLALSPKNYILNHLPNGRPFLHLDLKSRPSGAPYLLSSPFPNSPRSDLYSPPDSTGTLESLRLMTSISHDAGVVTAIVIAGIYTEPGGKEPSTA